MRLGSDSVAVVASVLQPGCLDLRVRKDLYDKIEEARIPP